MRKMLGLVVAVLLFGLPYVYGDEILNLKEKIIELQNQGELKIESLTSCSKINGFGSYVALGGQPRVKNGERFLVYFEPVNYFTKKTSLLYEINLSEDMLVLNEKVEIIWGKENAVSYHYNSVEPVLDLFITNAIDIKDIPEGKYTFKAVLNDRLKGKSAVKTLFFEVIK